MYNMHPGIEGHLKTKKCVLYMGKYGTRVMHLFERGTCFRGRERQRAFIQVNMLLKIYYNFA